MKISPRRDVDLWSVFTRAVLVVWSSHNFDKEYLFGYETLVFVTSRIVSMHDQPVTLQRESKT